MKKVVFLDRDGVINVEKGHYVYLPTDFEYVNGLFDGLFWLKNIGFEFIIVTNQGGISKKIYTHQEVGVLNQMMKDEFAKHQIPLLDIYYCPHHHEIEKCICRKPDSLMIEKAIAKHNIDISRSFMIGDNDRDVEAAEKAGIRGIKVNKNSRLLVYQAQIESLIGK